MYQTTLYWDTADQVPGQPSYVRDFTRSGAHAAGVLRKSEFPHSGF
jgi:hypothetical protein